MKEMDKKRCICSLGKFKKNSPYGFYSHAFLRGTPKFGTINSTWKKAGCKSEEYLLRIRFDSGELMAVSSNLVHILPFLLIEKTA